MVDFLKMLMKQPVKKVTWRSVVFFYAGERITWYFLRFGKRRFLWNTGHEDDMWYTSFDELERDIEKFDNVMAGSY